MCFAKEVLIKILQNFRKTNCAGVIFNKVRLATLIKKTPAQVFFCEFFEIINDTFFIKHLHQKNSHDYWSKVLFFSHLRFLILIDSILMDLHMGCRNFPFKHFTKERRNSLEFSVLFFSLINYMFFLFAIVGKVGNTLFLLAFVTCMIFFYVLFASFWPWMK